jgi:hypothetical protein
VTNPFLVGEGDRGWWIGQHGFELGWVFKETRKSVQGTCGTGLRDWNRWSGAETLSDSTAGPLGRHESGCLNRAVLALGSFCVGIEVCRKRVLVRFRWGILSVRPNRKNEAG